MKTIRSKPPKTAPVQTDPTVAPAELTLRGLRVFVAVEKTGSMLGAAAQAGIAPAEVSRHIAALESAIGAPLFDATTMPVSLTPAGQTLRHHAQRILTAVSEAQAEMAEFSLTSLRQLTLAVIADLDAALTPPLVSWVQSRFNGCSVHAVSGQSNQVVNRLIAREADIGVTAMLPADAQAYRILPILKEPFILVAAKGAINIKDPRAALDALPFVQVSETLPLGRRIAQYLLRVRLNPGRRFALEATRSVMAMVVQTGGWAITTPLNLLDAERFIPQLDAMPLPFADETRRVYLIARGDELGRLPDDLAKECRALIRTRLVPHFNRMAPALAGVVEVAEDEV